MAATICKAAPDVELQREYDARRGVSFRLLLCRFAAVIAARKAVVEDEACARFALRQALVDLGACAQELAATLPAPRVPMEPRRKQPRRR